LAAKLVTVKEHFVGGNPPIFIAGSIFNFYCFQKYQKHKNILAETSRGKKILISNTMQIVTRFGKNVTRFCTPSEAFIIFSKLKSVCSQHFQIVSRWPKHDTFFWARNFSK